MTCSSSGYDAMCKILPTGTGCRDTESLFIAFAVDSRSHAITPDYAHYTQRGGGVKSHRKNSSKTYIYKLYIGYRNPMHLINMDLKEKEYKRKYG